GSNPSSRWRLGVPLVVMVLGWIAPVATSRAQDASSPRASVQDVESLRAMKVVTIDGGEAISITSGAASITLKKDGTVVIKGTEIVLDNGRPPSTKPGSLAPVQPPSTSSRASEIF
ncbi:MAG: hypothetical protein K0S65_1231, partial [Labilithrix sp.]|nr:hypothetical protein [Labilithrix sp.]